MQISHGDGEDEDDYLINNNLIYHRKSRVVLCLDFPRNRNNKASPVIMYQNQTIFSI